MTTREKGSGSIDTTSAGRHRARVTGLDGKRRTIGVFDERDEAERVLRAALAELESGAAAPSDGLTVATLGEQWLLRRKGAGVRNIRTDRGRWKNHVATAAFGSWALGSILPVHIYEWLDVLAETKKADGQPLSHQSIKHCLNLLRSCLEMGVRRGLLSSNPAGTIRAPEPSKKQKANAKRWTFLTLDEQTALLDVIEGPERWLVAFAIASGLREGEQWNLELKDVHLTGPDPHVVVRWGGRNHEPPKNGHVREVPLTDRSLHAMQEWLRALPKWAKKNPQRVVFPTRRGAKQPEKKAPRHWAAWKKAAGITRAFWWHDLRHTCAAALVSGMWGRSWRLEEIKELLGHSSITITQRYAHLADTALKAAARETREATAALSDVSEMVSASNRPRIGHDDPEIASLTEENARIPRPSKPPVVGSSPTGRASQNQGDPSSTGASFEAAVAASVADCVALLDAAGRGDGKAAARLADAVVLRVSELAIVRLRDQVTAGGPLAMTRAIELADHLLALASGLRTAASTPHPLARGSR